MEFSRGMQMLKLSIKKRLPPDDICVVDKKVSRWIISSNFSLRPEDVEEEKKRCEVDDRNDEMLSEKVEEEKKRREDDGGNNEAKKGADKEEIEDYCVQLFRHVLFIYPYSWLQMWFQHQ